jgi:hypothetical protein
MLYYYSHKVQGLDRFPYNSSSVTKGTILKLNQLIKVQTQMDGQQEQKRTKRLCMFHRLLHNSNLILKILGDFRHD